MKKMHSPALLVLMLALFGTALIGAGLVFAAPNDLPAPPAASEEATPPADEDKISTTCGESPQWLGVEPIIDIKPKPDDVCNCNRSTAASDCKRVCGDVGGTCEITTDCLSPDWEGVCFCNN